MQTASMENVFDRTKWYAVQYSAVLLDYANKPTQTYMRKTDEWMACLKTFLNALTKISNWHKD